MTIMQLILWSKPIMGYKDKARVEQPNRTATPKPVVTTPTYVPPLHPINFPTPSTPTPATKEIPLTTQPMWAKPKSDCPVQWRNVNAFSKVFLFPGIEIQVGPKQFTPSHKGEVIWLYHSTDFLNVTFIDDTTEALFRQYFDFEGM